MVPSDVIVGVFSRDELSSSLVTVHRAGFGPQARVLDSTRGPLADQLRRAGYQISASFAADDAETVLIMLTAPGRAERAVEALTRAGATAVYAATRTTQAPPVPVPSAGVDVPPLAEPVAMEHPQSPPAEGFDR